MSGNIDPNIYHIDRPPRRQAQILYHQRCGCPLREPYTWDIRMNPFYMLLYDTNARPGEANLDVRGDEPSFKCYGGCHDAGDADRRLYHRVVPPILLTTYEAFLPYRRCRGNGSGWIICIPTCARNSPFTRHWCIQPSSIRSWPREEHGMTPKTRFPLTRRERTPDPRRLTAYSEFGCV